jgi:hypothetical protein
MFVPQLRAYGQAAGVPEAIWAPVEDDLSALTQSEAKQRVLAISGAVESHFAPQVHASEPVLKR